MARETVSLKTGLAERQSYADKVDAMRQLREAPRLMSGERGLSMEALEKLANYLDLEIIVRPRRRKGQNHVA